MGLSQKATGVESVRGIIVKREGQISQDGTTGPDSLGVVTPRIGKTCSAELQAKGAGREEEYPIRRARCPCGNDRGRRGRSRTCSSRRGRMCAATSPTPASASLKPRQPFEVEILVARYQATEVVGPRRRFALALLDLIARLFGDDEANKHRPLLDKLAW